ncbi:formate/nitrite transporter family protein [Sporosalibacterium faouarense]|uniref:formate/nitrite transporter family protein n=1 Tax=Sporosalibacterium faouarense TaxID=516123 RepID=UPI00192C46F2|nr:formate/nitrite transporter family protein [Sporosalibacterium faouarense]
MEKRYLAPSEVAEYTIIAGETKAKLSIVRTLLLAIMAGIFIGLGAYGDIIVMQSLSNIDIGLMKFLGAFVFPVGLMLVVIAGAELFTGNNLMTLALASKKITLKQLLRNWFLVYLGNFIGSIILAWSISYSNLLQENALNLAIKISESKLSLTFGEAFIRAILCNFIVVLAVWMGTAARDITSRILATWFPIMLFVLSGYEHSIANMFFLSLGKFSGITNSWLEIWYNNLIPVTLGNIVGGAIIVPGVYYITYILPAKK